MSVLLTLEIPGLPPTANSMYRNSGTHRYKRQEVTEWQEEVSGLMREHWNRNAVTPGAVEAPSCRSVEVQIEFTVKGRYRWDIDNRLKALLDCLEIGGILANDNQIDSLKVTRTRGNKDSTRIILMEYEGENINA